MSARSQTYLVFALALVTACQGAAPADAPPAGAPRPATSSTSPPSSIASTLLLLDVSGSMRASVGPPGAGQATGSTRLELAKQGARRWIGRKPRGALGLVVFATEAVVVAPPAEHHEDVAKLLEAARVDGVVDPGGTAFGVAIDVAVRRLSERVGPGSIVLITDGEHTLQQQTAGSKPVPGAAEALAAAGTAHGAGIPIHVIQVGDEEAGDAVAGRDIFNAPIYQKLETPRDRELLGRLASTTGGRYFVVKTLAELESALAAVAP